MQIAWTVTCHEHLIQIQLLIISHFLPCIQGTRTLLSEENQHTDCLSFWQGQSGETWEQLFQLHLRVLCWKHLTYYFIAEQYKWEQPPQTKRLYQPWFIPFTFVSLILLFLATPFGWYIIIWGCLVVGRSCRVKQNMGLVCLREKKSFWLWGNKFLP